MPQLQWEKKSTNGTTDGSVAISAKHSLTYADGNSTWFSAHLWGEASKATSRRGLPWHLHVDSAGMVIMEKDFSTPEEGVLVAQGLLDDTAAQLEIENADKREKRAKAKAVRVEMEQKIDELLAGMPRESTE